MEGRNAAAGGGYLPGKLVRCELSETPITNLNFLSKPPLLMAASAFMMQKPDGSVRSAGGVSGNHPSAQERVAFLYVFMAFVT